MDRARLDTLARSLSTRRAAHLGSVFAALGLLLGTAPGAQAAP